MSPMLRTFRSRQAAMSVAGILLVGMLALAACVAPFSGHNAAPTPPTAPNPISPAWTAVLKQIGPKGEVSLATAEQAYALVFGPLPGVSAPANAGGLIPDGTLALRMILAHYNELNAAQQQMVLKRFGFTAPATAERSSVSQTLTNVAGAIQTAQGARMSGPGPIPTDAPGTSDYRQMLNADIAKINGFLNYTLTLPIALGFDPKTKDLGDTICFDAQGAATGTPKYCRIWLNAAFGSYQPDDQQFVIAHELFHCYEAALMNNMHAWALAPHWLIEGAAEWVGALVGGATSDTSSLTIWQNWLAVPALPLFSRAYTAIGFYALLDQAGISPWSVFPAMLASQTKGQVPDNLGAYQAATQSAPQEVLDEWASSLERNKSLGLDWDITGPGIPTTTTGGPEIHTATVADGASVSVSTPAYTAIDYDLTSSAEVVQVNIAGTSRLHDGASFEVVTSANGSYCTKSGGCTCPAGSSYTGPALSLLTGVLHLAVTGGPSGANGSVTGMSLDQFCNQKPKPTGVPTITEVFCQHVLSLAEANQIMQPPTAATTIRVDKSPAGGSCNYEYGAYHSVVSLIFVDASGGPGNAAEKLAAMAAKISSNPDAKTTATPVNGVGDAAVFVTATIASPPLRIAAFDVIDGALFLSCGNFNVGSASFADQQTKLTHACQLVLGRL